MIYLTPTTVKEALGLLQTGEATLVAGCTDFFPSQRPGCQDRSILDITRVADLRGISATGTGWRIGAATTWTDVIKAPLPPAFDGLKLAAREVGSVQIQNAGTVAGNICNASPAADGVPPLLTLDAEVEIASAESVRRVPLARFVTGVRSVDLRPGEMVIALHVPAVSDAARSAFLKLGSRKYLVISIAMVAVVLELDDGRIGDIRIAVGACSPVAQRLPALEDHLRGRTAATVETVTIDEAGHLAPLRPIDDVRGTADYRRKAVADLCRRAVLQAMGATPRETEGDDG